MCLLTAMEYLTDGDAGEKTINHHGKARTVLVASAKVRPSPFDTEMVGRINMLILAILNFPRRNPPNLFLWPQQGIGCRC